MKTIYKYAVPIEDHVTIYMPAGAQVLTVQEQSSGWVQLWALVDSENPSAPRRFRVVGTGHPFNDADDWRYIATVQLHGGALVFHVFEERQESVLPKNP